ncbi:MAG TPA: PqqD family protein [Bryobacteraceae bacterium]|nr:PqqD family protein [Bryobacteraceae bacterium]
MAILSLKNGIYYGLDAVGSRVWELVQTPRCFGDLQATLLAEYDVEPALLSRDLGRLCTSLAGAGLIEIRDAKGN